MTKIIECVPNFSEGRDMNIINAITQEIKDTEGAVLLDVDPGKDTNRTVVTFVGGPEAVAEAAFRAVAKAGELIDMSRHSGAHARMGATDVCPFIPVSGVTIEECIEVSKQVAKRVGEELGIPAFLYAKSATRPEREKLPDIRKGEYEALPAKLKDPDFAPDYGKAEFNARSGATAFGVRGFLLAYNINLNTRETKFAREIGMNIRETGRAKRDKDGVIIRHPDGKPVKVPGKLQFCQAAGWYIDEYGYAQVTMNLHNYEVTGLHTAFDMVVEEAAKFGLRVTGSELIGLAPKEAILQSGRHYLAKMGKTTAVPESELVHTAILSLGLEDTTPFDPAEKIIEYKIKGAGGELAGMTLTGFADLLSSEAPAPGGGSVSAYSGALSAGLSSMMAALTHGKKEHKRYFAKMEEMGIKAQNLKDEFLHLIDADTESFNNYMSAMRMKKKSDEEIAARNAAMEAAAKEMTSIPLQTLRLSAQSVELADYLTQKGNPNALSDAGCAALQAEAAAEGAYYNVLINLPSVKDETFVHDVRQEADALLLYVTRAKKRISQRVRKKLG